jgi:predicted ATP-grasp superfamily ATP-dependent carboligase
MGNTTAFIISHESDSSRTEHTQDLSIIALTLTRSLGREGVRVVRIHPNLLDDSLYSRYSVTTEVCPDFYQSESELTTFLTELGDRYPGEKVLIPASDDCSLYLARNSAELSDKFILLNPSANTMESVKDKRRQYELAMKAGVPIPETYFPENDDDIVDIAGQLTDYPYIIKPLEAQKWRLRQFANAGSGRKAIVVHSRDALIEEYRRIAEVDKNLMVQEIIGGKDELLLTFLGYCSTNQKPLAHCVRSKLRQFPVDFGYCTATVSCHNAVVEQYSKRLLRHSNYEGIVGIEFKFDPVIDDYKLIEINTRPVNTLGISTACGVNLPMIAFRDATGMRPESVSDWQDGVTWLRLTEDFGSARQLRKLGRMSYIGWLRSIRGKRVHAVLAADDLRPFFKFYGRYLRRQFGKLKRASGLPTLNRYTRRWLQRVTAWML